MRKSFYAVLACFLAVAAVCGQAGSKDKRKPSAASGGKSFNKSVAGTYESYTYLSDSEWLTGALDVAENGGKLRASFSAASVHEANGARISHEAAAGGELDFRGGTATGTIDADGAKAAPPCRLTIAFTAARAKVRTGANCGFRAAFGGVYKKQKNASPKNAEFAEKIAAVPFDALRAFVGDYEAQLPGTRFVADAVPLIKEIRLAEKSGGDFNRLYRLSADGERNVATSFIATKTLVDALLPKLRDEIHHLRVECYVVKVSGAGEVYHTPYATRVEAVRADGTTVWTITDLKVAPVGLRY